MSRISRDELRIVFDRVLEKLDEEQLELIDIEEDAYRYIPTDEWSRFDKDVIELGSLQDDIESLLKLTLSNDRITTFVDFDRLASVLRAISQKENPPKS